VPSSVKWFYHPKEDESSDVAVCQVILKKEIFASLDYTAIAPEMFVTDEAIESEGIGPGDEVFVTGLFALHTGNKRNMPIVRMGNIAMIPKEPVPTHHFGNMEVYLVESRSIGGLSGSPVFVVKDIEYSRWRIYLLGLIHGHWEVDPQTIIDMTGGDSKKRGGVNMGIAIVIPAKKIIETIMSKELDAVRQELDSHWIERNSPKTDESS